MYLATLIVELIGHYCYERCVSAVDLNCVSVQGHGDCYSIGLLAPRSVSLTFQLRTGVLKGTLSGEYMLLVYDKNLAYTICYYG